MKKPLPPIPPESPPESPPDSADERVRMHKLLGIGRFKDAGFEEDQQSVDVSGWWPTGDKMIGSACVGKVLARKTFRQKRDGEERAFYAVELAEACSAVDHDEEITLAPGDVIAVSEVYKLRGLAEYVGSGRVVAIVNQGKIKLGTGQTMHQFRILSKKAPAPQDAGEVPF